MPRTHFTTPCLNFPPGHCLVGCGFPAVASATLTPTCILPATPGTPSCACAAFPPYYMTFTIHLLDMDILHTGGQAWLGLGLGGFVGRHTHTLFWSSTYLPPTPTLPPLPHWDDGGGQTFCGGAGHGQFVPPPAWASNIPSPARPSPPLPPTPLATYLPQFPVPLHTFYTPACDQCLLTFRPLPACPRFGFPCILHFTRQMQAGRQASMA